MIYESLTNLMKMKEKLVNNEFQFINSLTVIKLYFYYNKKKMDGWIYFPFGRPGSAGLSHIPNQRES